MRSRIVRWALALCLLLSVTAFVPAASAAAAPCDGTHGEGWVALGSMEDLLSDEVKYALTPAGDNPTTLTIKAGKYYLTADIKTEYSICFYGGTTVLCLNGHTISGDWESIKGAHLLGANGANRNVTICSCAPGGALRVTSSTGKAPSKAADAKYVLTSGSYNAVFDLYDIAIHDSYGRNGAIYMRNSSVLNVYGVSMTANRGTAAQANDVVLHENAVMNLYDGVIDDSADFCRDICAIDLLSATNTLNVYGGTIIAKDAEGGGTINNEAGGTVNVYGGTLVGPMKGTANYLPPFTVNGAAPTVDAPGASYSDEIVDYNGENFTLTAKADFTLGLALPTDQAMTLDLNGHTVTAEGGMLTVLGTLTVADGAAGGALVGRILLNPGAGLTLTGGELRGAGEALNVGGAGVSVGTGATFTMAGGRIVGHSTTKGGGAVAVAGTFEMSGGVIGGTEDGEGNSAAYGGAVSVGESGTFHMTGGSIVGNFTDGDDWRGAGGVFNCGTFVMDDGMIAMNSTQKGGGGVFVYKSSFTMNGGVIDDNFAGTTGGGVRVAGEGASFIMNDGEITGNVSGSYGGGVDAEANVALNGGLLKSNVSGGYGAGLAVLANGNALMDGAVLAENNSESYGGGLYVNGGSFTMASGTVGENTSVRNGAGIGVGGGGTVTICGGTVTGNISQGACGGVYVNLNGTLNIIDGVIAGNRGPLNEDTGKPAAGADIYVGGVGTSVTMSGGTVGTGELTNSFWGYCTSEGTSTVEITDGTVLDGIGFGGNTADVNVNIRGGRFRLIPKSTYGVHIYGGAFGAQGNLLDYAAVADPVIADSGVEGYPYAVIARADLAAVTGVSLDKVTLALEVGGTDTLTATVAPDNAGDKSVSWTSDNEAVATVADGVVTAVGAGTANITVTTTDGGFTDFCTVTVTQPSAGTPGDLTGDNKVNAKDIVMLQRFVAGGYDVALTLQQADLNGDGKANAKDIVLLQRFVAGGYDVSL